MFLLLFVSQNETRIFSHVFPVDFPLDCISLFLDQKSYYKKKLFKSGLPYILIYIPNIFICASTKTQDWELSATGSEVYRLEFNLMQRLILLF